MGMQMVSFPAMPLKLQSVPAISYSCGNDGVEEED